MICFREIYSCCLRDGIIDQLATVGDELQVWDGIIEEYPGEADQSAQHCRPKEAEEGCSKPTNRVAALVLLMEAHQADLMSPVFQALMGGSLYTLVPHYPLFHLSPEGCITDFSRVLRSITSGLIGHQKSQIAMFDLDHQSQLKAPHWCSLFADSSSSNADSSPSNAESFPELYQLVTD